MTTILVVCSGNLCRSPFAEGILRRLLVDRFGPSAPTVSSVGTIARKGAPPTKEALLVGSEHGLDLSEHAARRLAREHVADADLILAMTAEHRHAVARLDAQADRKTFTLKELVRVPGPGPGPCPPAGARTRGWSGVDRGQGRRGR